ncbi:erythromycin esterase family protein [Streptomyces sp. URMC 125]|uniref:erythromycin esterase family protein n=1 Tax=Streptomyces sp. URMC 125 TaxID=3423419 RepID=UPI003F1BC3F7
MRANTEVLEFARWLREYNTALPAEDRVGFFGLDVHSLWESLHAVLDHLREHDPDQVGHARAAYGCFEPYAQDPQSYALATRMVPAGCRREVVPLLAGLRERAGRRAAASAGRPALGGAVNADPPSPPPAGRGDEAAGLTVPGRGRRAPGPLHGRRC